MGRRKCVYAGSGCDPRFALHLDCRQTAPRFELEVDLAAAVATIVQLSDAGELGVGQVCAHGGSDQSSRRGPVRTVKKLEPSGEAFRQAILDEQGSRAEQNDAQQSLE